jgi:hypothetical protein
VKENTVVRSISFFMTVAVLAMPHAALAKKKAAPEPPECPVDETIRIANAASFERLESLAGCRDNVIVAPADEYDTIEALPPPVRIRPREGVWHASTDPLDGSATPEGALGKPGKQKKRDRLTRVSNNGGTPYVRIMPPADEVTEGESLSVDPGAPSVRTTPSSADAILAMRPTRYRTIHDDLISQVAYRHRIDPLLLHAVITQESGYKQSATSNVGARGLMQIMPATGAMLGVRSQYLNDPATNIDAGARLLRKLAVRYKGNFDLVLAAYNAGEGAVQKYGNQIPPYRETQNYVRSVMGHYYKLLNDQPGGGPAR